MSMKVEIKDLKNFTKRWLLICLLKNYNLNKKFLNGRKKTYTKYGFKKDHYIFRTCKVLIYANNFEIA